MCYFCTTLRFNIPKNVSRRQKFLIVKKEEVPKPPFSFGTSLTPQPLYTHKSRIKLKIAHEYRRFIEIITY